MKRTTIYAIDPGTRESGLIGIDAGTRTVLEHSTRDNDHILAILHQESDSTGVALTELFEHEKVLVVEQVEGMGMPLGRDIAETIWWAGRFHQAWRGTRSRVTRREIKLHLCGSMRAKDANVRAALLDYYGGKDAIGTKKTPGPLYGVKGHEFAALAVAVTFLELHFGGDDAKRPTESAEKAESC